MPTQFEDILIIGGLLIIFIGCSGFCMCYRNFINTNKNIIKALNNPDINNSNNLEYTDNHTTSLLNKKNYIEV